jgi:hypothetical protein
MARPSTEKPEMLEVEKIPQLGAEHLVDPDMSLSDEEKKRKVRPECSSPMTVPA